MHLLFYSPIKKKNLSIDIFWFYSVINIVSLVWYFSFVYLICKEVEKHGGKQLSQTEQLAVFLLSCLIMQLIHVFLSRVRLVASIQIFGIALLLGCIVEIYPGYPAFCAFILRQARLGGETSFEYVDESKNTNKVCLVFVTDKYLIVANKIKDSCPNLARSFFSAPIESNNKILRQAYLVDIGKISFPKP